MDSQERASVGAGRAGQAYTVAAAPQSIDSRGRMPRSCPGAIQSYSANRRLNCVGGGGHATCRCRPDGLVNINPRHAADPFYRYTMPPFDVHVVAGGTNGVKTLLYNVDKIADSLRR